MSSAASMPAIPSVPTAGTLDDRTRLVEEYAPLVRRIAGRIAARLPCSVQVEDLVSVGTLGLLDAIEKFDPRRNTSFRSYCEFRIRGAILDELRNLDWVPRSVRQKAGEVERIYRHLLRELHRWPTDEEVAAALGVDLPTFHDLLVRIRPMKVVSFEDLAADRNSQPPETLLVLDDRRPDPHTSLHLRRLRERLARAIEALPEKHRIVLGLYYFEDLNLKEVGMVLGLTESRVSQIHGQAIVLLRSLVGEDD